MNEIIIKICGSTMLAKITIAGVIFALTNTALANEGFYQGAGSSLTLVKNSYLRVREEALLIAPIIPPDCYSVYVNNKTLVDGMDVKGDAKVTLGSHEKCQSNTGDAFYAKWRATADYLVEALQSQQGVLIGFPVETWKREFNGKNGDLYSVYAPSVVNFRTYLNDEEIKSLELKKLKSHDIKTRARDLLGYTWLASFEAGKSYHLRAEYDFGVDNSNAFYKGREYLTGETPWFFGAVHEPFPAERMIYFLTPISSWASPPPEQIKIEVQLPSEIPVTYFVPLELKPICVTSTAFHYLLKNQFPSSELMVSMPSTGWRKKGRLEPLRTLAQWKKWKKTLGGDSVKIGCDIIDELKKTAAPDLQAHLNTVQCISSCSE